MRSLYALLSHGSDDDARSDSEEASSANDSEGCQAGDTARPQIIRGNPVRPPFWGINQKQVLELLGRLRRDPAWNQENNVHTLVSDFIIPWTSGHGLGYALLINQDSPKEANVFISHAFAENAEEFLETVVRATRKDDVLFICALAIYQAEDGFGPSIADQLGTEPQDSPFRQVLTHIRSRSSAFELEWTTYRCLEELPVLLLLTYVLAVCLPTMFWRQQFDRLMNDREWSREMVIWLCFAATCLGCFFLLYPMFVFCIRRGWHGGLAYSGRMVAVPNREVDIYSRLWCVYEIFVAVSLGVNVALAPTLVSAGKVSSRHATCSRERDIVRIRAEIEGSRVHYRDIDGAVKRTVRSSLWHSTWVLVKYVVLQALPMMMYFDLPSRAHIPVGFWFLLLVGLYSFLLLTMYAWTKTTEGILQVSTSRFAMCALILFLEPILFWWTVHEGYIEAWWGPILVSCTRELRAMVVVVMASLCRPFPDCFRAEYRIRTLLTMVCGRFLYEITTTCAVRSCDSWSDSPSVLIDGVVATWTWSIAIYTFWTEGLRFGVHVVVPASHDERLGKQAWIVLCMSMLAMCMVTVRTKISWRALYPTG